VLGALKKFYPDFDAEVIDIDTYGDRDKITPISEIEETDFFTREIEEALLRGEIDFAVHSAKDLPQRLPPGLCIAAITQSVDAYDALVAKNNLTLGELPYGAKIGVSSRRRKRQLKVYRQDFQLVDIRGNIQERLEKLESLKLDAVIIAAAALIRLGLEGLITERLPREILAPHPLQGALALEVRCGDEKLIELLGRLDKQTTSYRREGFLI
jgi:hydroxymethylbilane synthase